MKQFDLKLIEKGIPLAKATEKKLATQLKQLRQRKV